MNSTAAPTNNLLRAFKTEVIDRITDSERRRARRRLQLKAVFIMVWAGLSYYQLLFGHHGWLWSAVMLLSLALAASCIAMAIMHDGNHGGFSRYKSLNRLSGFTLDLIGSSSALWCIKHNKAHHNRPNWMRHDSDIEQEPFARLAPHQQWRPYHRYQHVYMWFLYSFLFIKAPFADFINLRRGHIGSYSLAHVTKWQKAEMVAGKLVFATWVFVIPSLLYPIWLVLAGYMLAGGLLGFLLAITFQLAHCVDNAEFHADTAPRGDWLAEQLASTVDIYGGNWLLDKVLNFMTGGLNRQVEHHCAPGEPHTLYSRLGQELETFCFKHNLQYRYHRTLWAALKSHQRWLRAMGKRPIPASTADAA